MCGAFPGSRRQPCGATPRSRLCRLYRQLELAKGLSELLDVAARLRTAIMCAEAVWWRCPRGINRRCVVCAGHQGGAYHRRDARCGASLHIAGPYRSGPTELCVRGRQAICTERGLAGEKRLGPPAQFRN